MAENWRYCATNAPLNTPCKQWLVAVKSGAHKEEQASDIPAFHHALMVSHGVAPRSADELPRYGQAPDSATRPFSIQSTEWLVR
ncbi:MAG: hypothetical protein EBZ60_00170 [Betaproteobacteria bacterium]|nr:hypothetical protein [Betaproteobacteria bacterium]